MPISRLRMAAFIALLFGLFISDGGGLGYWLRASVI